MEIPEKMLQILQRREQSIRLPIQAVVSAG